MQRAVVMKASGLSCTLMLAAVLGLSQATPAAADDVADFYRGKQITLLVEAIGSGYGNNGRLIAEFMGKYIPGQPKLVMVAKPGAGGRAVMNYLYNIAPRDGTAIGFLHKDIGAFSLLQPEGVQYDTKQFRWLGRVAPMNTVLYVTDASGVTSLDGAKQREVVMAANGTTHPTAFFPTLINNLLGTKFKVVAGYRGGADVMLAVERGEAGGTTNSWDSVTGRYPNWRQDGRFHPLVVLSLEKETELPDVQALLDLVSDPRDREVVEFLVSGSQVGRALAAPPQVPDDRLAALRKAFDLTMKDPEYLATAAKGHLTVEPRAGADIQVLVDRAASASPDLVARAKAAIGLH
jgi:tripartite-type tricarboxylate transporter receptor subunit TctC